MGVLDLIRPKPLDVEALVRQAAQEAATVARAEVIEEFRRAVVATSPLPAPQAPGPSPHGAYAYDNPYRYTVPQPPYRRPGSVVSLDTLRKVSDTYDVLRACIQHLKRETLAVPLSIVTKDDGDDTDASKKRIAEANAFFSQRGGLGGEGRLREEFEGQFIEDLCVIGAAAIYYEPTRGGKPYQVECIDAATIRPRVDAYGWPGPGEEVWEQWIYGVKVVGFTREEMGYYGLSVNARSWTPFFASPVEWLIQTVLTALKADEWNASWLTDGNVPSLLLAAPPDWTPEQILSHTAYLDLIFSGNSQERQKVKMVAGGTHTALNPSRKDQDFEQFQLWLLRRCCAIMGVQPASVGFAGEQYKVSQEDSMESTSAFGVGVILEYRRALYNDVLARLGYDDLEIQNVTGREEEAKERAARNVSLVTGGIKTPNEARQDEGLDPIDGADELIVQNTMTTLALAMKPPPEPEPRGVPGGNGSKPPLRVLRAAAEDEAGGHWVTIHGQAVFINAAGEITKGPSHLVGKEAGKDEGEARHHAAKVADERKRLKQAVQDDEVHPMDAKQRDAKLKDHADAIKAHVLHLQSEGSEGGSSSGKAEGMTVEADEEADGLARELFGRKATAKEYAGIAGALKGSTADVYAQGDELRIEIKGGDLADAGSEWAIRKGDDGKTVAELKMIALKDDAPAGTGTVAFARSVEQLRAMNVSRIDLEAARDEDMVGYYVWPRLGADAPIPQRVRGDLPAGLSGARNVSDLMKTDKGRSWWKVHGVTVDATFELGPSKRSSKVLAAYVQERGLDRAA